MAAYVMVEMTVTDPVRIEEYRNRSARARMLLVEGVA